MIRWTSWSGHRWLAVPVRLYLGGLFIAACVHKIGHPASFAVDVATYRLLPLSTINLFAVIVPWVELMVGLMLVLGIRVRAAALVTSGLMASFMIALGWALVQGLDMSCGCFASQAAAEYDPISWRTMLRDATWLALGLYVMCLDHQPLGVESLARKRR
jgi:putative oxidoreductase